MRLITLLLPIALAILLAHSANSDDQRRLVKLDPWQAYIDWCVDKPEGAGDYGINICIASNQHDQTVTYISADLTYGTVRSRDPLSLTQRPAFTGGATRYSTPPTTGAGVPFHECDKDKLHVQIFPKSNEVVLILESDNHRRISFTGEWQKNNTFYGVSADSPYAGYIISFKKIMFVE